MGVKNLWDILESCKQTLPIHHLQNKRICVDLSCWLIQLQTANRSPNCMKEKLYLKGLFHRVRALIALNCSLVFVTDGSIPSIKLSTYRQRLGVVLEVVQETNTQTIQSLRRNMGSEFSCMIKEAKALGMALGIPCLDGIEEAEAQCASLNSESLCDGCFTSDSDIFLFGARTVYRDILIGEGGYVTCYEMVDIERKLGFGRSSLISLALLLGSDYSPGVRGFGPETACRIVKAIGEDNVLHQMVSEGLIVARKNKGSKKPAMTLNSDVNKENEPANQKCTHVNDENPDLKDQFQQVINAYLNPKCHCPDSEAVRRVGVQHPFLRKQFHETCERYFGWNTDQTDQYILPKIAERDLRRFANLRAKSSELGATIPLEKMPVPCPLAAVVKQRRLHKIECYEVSWNAVDGLQTSIVPSDLVESACPEKIAEFQEKKVEAKKQKRRPRPKKSTNAGVSEVDLPLQGQLLSIEPESNAIDSTSSHQHSASLSTESQSSFSETASSLHPNGLDSIDSEIVDLSTPSPSLRASKVANSHKEINLRVNVIDLSESEREQGIEGVSSLSMQSGHLCACPEKMTELPEKKVETKNQKRRPRPKKSTNVGVSEVDLQLQGLLLSTEPVSDAIHSTSSQQHSASFSTESQSSSSETASILPHPNVPDSIDSEIIDLSTPSPSLRASKFAKFQKDIKADVVDLSESETERSLEHERKARELRLFIESVKGDLY